MEEKIRKKRISVIVLGVITLFALAVTILMKPENGNVSEEECEKIQAQVTKVTSQRVSKRQTDYFVEVSYSDNTYELIPYSTNVYKEGITYPFYLYDGKVYRDLREINLQAANAETTGMFRAAVLIAFVGAIVWIGLFTSYVRTRNRKK